MAQPTPYTRQFGFTDFAASYPSSPPPGTALDAEANAVKVTLDAVLNNLAIIQRDDGALKNSLVTLDSLSPQVMLALGAGVIWLPRGAWVTTTSYAVSDVIQKGTASYVCAVTHTSGVFATDFAAGKWVMLFDSAGATPADGSVGTVKLADGSVTTPKIGFTGLDLSGNIRGATGIQAGTAPLGSLMHAKAAAGSVLVTSERTTDAQGAVGFKIIGVTCSWTLQQAASSDDLALANSTLLGVPSTIFTETGGLDQTGNIRSTGTAAPTAGKGVSMSYSASVGYLNAFDYDGTLWLDLKLRGLNTYLAGGGVDIVKVTSTGFDVIAGYARKAGVDLGYLDMPLNVQSTAYTLALTDRGKCVYSSNVAGQAVTVPANATVAFNQGSVVGIQNAGTNAITLTPAAGVTIKQRGTGTSRVGGSGTWNLAVNGFASLQYSPTTNLWWLDGVGLS